MFIVSLTNVKVEFRVDPSVFTVMIMATEIPAAMRPYSMAVAPESSLINFFTKFFMSNLPDQFWNKSQYFKNIEMRVSRSGPNTAEDRRKTVNGRPKR